MSRANSERRRQRPTRPVTESSSGTCTQCAKTDQMLLQTCTAEAEGYRQISLVCEECAEKYTEARAAREVAVKRLYNAMPARDSRRRGRHIRHRLLHGTAPRP
jgi:hypothetical protein